MVGEVPLGPVQHWLFDTLGGDPARLTQAVSFELAADPDEALLRAALAAVLDHHDALRLRFEAAGQGSGASTAAPPARPPTCGCTTCPARRTPRHGWRR